MCNKVIVCLAKSAKNRGLCIAGKEFDTKTMEVGEWVRPVSGDTHEISNQEARLTNGNEIQLRDIVHMQELTHEPYDHQTENYHISDQPWSLLGHLSPKLLNIFVDSPHELWPPCSSSRHGVRDRISADEVTDIDNSLYLLRVQNPHIRVETDEFEGRIRHKTRLSFEYNATPYKLRVTDPRYNWDMGRSTISAINDRDEIYITISLTPVWNGACYRLVASIL